MTAATAVVTAPAGSHFETEEVQNKAGDTFSVPILVFDDAGAAQLYYGEEGILRILDGTSLRVQFQGIARRMAQAGKLSDEIAKAEAEYHPGARRVGESTPANRVAKAARKAAESRPADAEIIAKLLDRLTSGELSAEEVAALL